MNYLKIYNTIIITRQNNPISKEVYGEKHHIIPKSVGGSKSSIKNLASGSAKSMSNISKERLSNLRIILPPIDLQNRFASFITQINKSKSEIQKSLDKLETLKKALMQQYFG